MKKGEYDYFPRSKPQPLGPVHSDRGAWYFWDETWTDEWGPFPDEYVATVGVTLYSIYCLLNYEEKEQLT